MDSRLHIWTMYWVEWILTIFSRTFSIEKVFILWDFIIVLGDKFIFKILYGIFAILDKYFDRMD